MRNCRSDRRETGTQIGQRGKTENRIGYQNRKPVSIFREKRNQMLKYEKSVNRNEHQNRFFGTKTEKTFLKIAKTKNPNAPFL